MSVVTGMTGEGKGIEACRNDGRLLRNQDILLISNIKFIQK